MSLMTSLHNLHAQKTTTNAEISIKSGGYWENNVYRGGDFKSIRKLKIDKEKLLNSGFIKYEGPGWENKKIAYRLYLDQRAAIDVFGKKKSELILNKIGNENYGSYHEDSEWGQDILKVGNSLGLGGIARIENDQLFHFENVKKTILKILNFKKKSSLQILYVEWKTNEFTTDLEYVISIDNKDITFSTDINITSPISGLTTGIINNPNGEIIAKDGRKWAYFATYGAQTLVNETQKLGMVIFYIKNQFKKIISTKSDHLIIFKDNITKVNYFSGAAWDQLEGGIKNKQNFKAFLDKKLMELDDNKY